MMLDVKEGQGVVSTMLYDSATAETLKSTLVNLNQGTELLNENLEAMKYSFPVKKYFKKQAKEAAQAEQDSIQ